MLDLFKDGVPVFVMEDKATKLRFIVGSAQESNILVESKIHGEVRMFEMVSDWNKELFAQLVLVAMGRSKEANELAQQYVGMNFEFEDAVFGPFTSAGWELDKSLIEQAREAMNKLGLGGQ